MTAQSEVTTRTALLDGHEATVALGERLGQCCVEGDVLALCGPLAAGKTTLSQGLALGLGVLPDQRVRSPSFALCNEYPGRLHVLHVDLYRVASVDEVEDLGFRERVGSEGVAIVEWADRFSTILPLHCLWLRLDHEGAQRRVTVWLQSRGGSASSWLERLPAPGPGCRWTPSDLAPPWEQPCSW
jgi:tRNA threonylcarbamoyladenosine biosynthesis protein TsaE